MRDVGELVLSTDRQWMVRPPQHCGNGDPATPGRVLVGSIGCACAGSPTSVSRVCSNG
jgi:hypothetical protein